MALCCLPPHIQPSSLKIVGKLIHIKVWIAKRLPSQLLPEVFAFYEVLGIKQKAESSPSLHDLHIVGDFKVLLKNHTKYIIYCCIASYHKLSSIQQLPFIFSQFCRSVVWAQFNWVLSLESHWAKIKAPLSRKAWGPLPSTQLLAELSSLSLVD